MYTTEEWMLKIKLALLYAVLLLKKEMGLSYKNLTKNDWSKNGNKNETRAK